VARTRDPNRDRALELFIEHKGAIANREIAKQLDVLEKTISAWKSRDKWNEKLAGEVCSTTKPKRSTTKNKSGESVRSKQKKQIINALVEAGTYSPALDLLIDLYLDAYEEYILDKTEKLRKELAKYLGQLGLDGKNKELIKKSGVLLDKGDEVKEQESEVPSAESSKLVQFRKRMSR
jgi:Phage terminase small subunit